MVVGKTDLVKELSMEMEISERVASKAITVVLECIMDELSKGNDVVLPGFGKFYVADVKERTTFGVTTPAHVVPRFKAGKAFKDALSS